MQVWVRLALALGTGLGTGLSTGLGGALSGVAQADELFVGAMAHDVTFIGNSIGLGAAGRESGTDLELGYRSAPMDSWTALKAPSVYAMASLNSRGDTSFISAGLAWKLKLGQSGHWYARPAIGLAAHNGWATLPDFRAPGLSVAEQQRRADMRKNHIEFGSKWLFQPEISLGYNLSSGDAIELSYVHLSNGQILGHGKNQGLDDLGLRFVHRFGAK